MKMSFGARCCAAPLSFAAGVLGAAFAQAQAQTEAPPDEVVVTGVPHERAPGELSQSVTVVGGEALDRSRAATLGETLANQVGVSSSYFGAGASRPIIRGLAGARVQMLEDGIDTMDAATLSDDHAVTVEPLAADQIEIFRTCDGRHFRRQRQRVRLMLEQRIRHHFDLVKLHALVKLGQTSRQTRRNKMNVVTAQGEFAPEFRPDNAASAV